MFRRSNCDLKSQFSGILIEPLNSRGVAHKTTLEFGDDI